MEARRALINAIAAIEGEATNVLINLDNGAYDGNLGTAVNADVVLDNVLETLADDQDELQVEWLANNQDIIPARPNFGGNMGQNKRLMTAWVQSLLEKIIEILRIKRWNILHPSQKGNKRDDGFDRDDAPGDENALRGLGMRGGSRQAEDRVYYFNELL